MMARPVSRKAVLAGLLGGAALLAGLSACERSGNGITTRSEIGFSIPSNDKAAAEALWGPLLADMARQTGLKIRPVYAQDADAQVEAMRGKRVQAGWFTNLTGIEALTRGHGEVFAEAESVHPLQSLIIVTADSKLTPPELLICDKRLTFGLGERISAASGQAPLYYFFQPAKIDPQTCFKRLSEISPRDAIDRVIVGKLNAAAIDSAALLEVQQAEPETFKKIKVIWASSALPDDVLIYRQDLDQVTREKLRSFFLSYGHATGAAGERQREVLRELAFEGFVPAGNTHFIPVRQMRASAELLRAERIKDPDAIAEAKADLARAHAEKRIVDAKTVLQLPADAQSASSF